MNLRQVEDNGFAVPKCSTIVLEPEYRLGAVLTYALIGLKVQSGGQSSNIAYFEVMRTKT